MAKSYPTGAIPLIEAQWSHREFATSTTPDYVLTKITSARQLLKRGETADSYFPEETTVITTTTIPDEKLNLLSWERELEIVREFEPDFHIPTDYSTYEDQPEDDRQHNIEQCLEGTLWMSRQLQTAQIEIIPLVKGCTPDEWALSYETLDRCAFDYPMVAFFATQYFSGGAGIRITELVEDVRTIAARQHRSILLIGLLSPNYLQRMPRSVSAGAGLNQWRKQVSPRKQSDEEMQAIWDRMSNEVNDALDQSGTSDHVAELPDQEIV